MTVISRDHGALPCIAVVVATTCIGSAALGETLDDALRALRAGYATLAVEPLQEAVRILRARADASDVDGSTHYHLARALEGLGLYHVSRGEQDEARRQFEDGVEAAKIAVARNPAAAPYHTELGNLYGNLASQSGIVGKMRNGRLSTAAFARARARPAVRPRPRRHGHREARNADGVRRQRRRRARRVPYRPHARPRVRRSMDLGRHRAPPPGSRGRRAQRIVEGARGQSAQ